MLDLIITYLNFFIIVVKYIVKLIAFQPPEPKGYRIKNFKNEVIEYKNNLELNPGDIIEILFPLPKKPKNESKSDDNLKENKTEEKNKEILIKRNQEYEYRLAPNTYSNYELIYFDNEDNNTITPAFLYKPNNSFGYFSNMKNYLVIYCHGNSGDIGTSFIECQLLSRNLCCNVLCFEYPGYGLSSDINNTNEKRAYFNIRQAYKYARNKLKYKPENIIIYGFSLGTGIAFDLACDKEYPTGGVILQSAFLSIIRTVYNFKRTYYFDLFNNCDKAKLCHSKIYFIHGDKDTIVPYIHGRILSKLIPKEYFCGFYTVPGADHNDILKHAKQNLYIMISSFIDSLNENKNPDEKSIDSYISYIKDIDEKPTNINNECGKRKSYEINEINNNISSNDELNALEKVKNNNKKDFNEIPVNFRNSINNFSEKKKDNENEKKKKENKENLRENEESDTISKKKEEDSKREEPKFLDSKNIKLNIDNYSHIISKSNEMNNRNSKSNEINNANSKSKINNENSKSNDNDSNDLSISFESK